MSFHLSSSLALDGYRLIRFLGRGGFGEVWLCRSESMGDYRALKFISTHDSDRLDKEYQALIHYRKAVAMLRSPRLVSIEHVNRNHAGLYYVMPLADGIGAEDPSDPAWEPLSLASKIHAQAELPVWFASQEITALIQPILEALQILSDAGLVHRDVKPENILFFNGQPCLGDISLLGEDASVITRRGTPGYATPSWYVGGHPDMYGVAATLFSLLTGNSPDRMGRAAFVWPPQGESSLLDSSRAEWKRLHAVIRRATNEQISERFVDFRAMEQAISGPIKPTRARLTIPALLLGGIVAGIMIISFRGGLTPTPIANEAPATTPGSLPQLTSEQTADYQALAGMIEGYIGQGQYGNALATVETLLATYPQARTQPAYSVARAMALKGLGRIEEAKEELRTDINLSPQLTPIITRKEMWEEFGDLASAEDDITRILDKFGPNTLILFLRADIRAQRGDFGGVLADKNAAYLLNPGESEQKRLVDTMWAPLEGKYPAYAAYLGAEATDGTSAQPPLTTKSGFIEPNPYDAFASLTSLSSLYNGLPGGFINGQENSILVDALEGMNGCVMPESLNVSLAIKYLDELRTAVPKINDLPVVPLSRLLLRQCNGEAVSAELENPAFTELHIDDLPWRVALLRRLNAADKAEEFLTKAISSGELKPHEQRKALLERADLYAACGKFPAAKADADAAMLTANGNKEQTASLKMEILGINGRNPDYAAYQKSLPEK